MAAEASKYNMRIGLKNALDIVDTLTPTVDFAVNEQCAQLSECDRYNAFLAAGKPVFHIEYPTPLNTSAANGVSCKASGTTDMSTILKNLALDGLAIYCDGSQVDTPTKGGTGPPRPTRTPRPTTRPTTTRPPTTRPTTTRPTTTRPTTTRVTTRPTTTTPRTSSTRPGPTSTSGPGNGCKSKHWDQCGGNNWNGCTVCEVSYLNMIFGSFADNYMRCSHRIHAKVFLRRGIISVYRWGCIIVGRWVGSWVAGVPCRSSYAVQIRIYPV